MRDFTKRRLDIALDRDSATLESLSRDAKIHHMSDQPGKMAAIRLADYYLIAEKLGTYSAEGILTVLAMLPKGLLHAEAVPESGEKSSVFREKEEEYIAPASNLAENADEAVDVWGSM